MPPRKLYPGQQLTAAEQNALVAKVRRMDQMQGAGDTTVVRDNGGSVVRDNRPDVILARITGAPTGAAYPYIEVAPNGDGTYTDVDAPFGRTGTATDNPAYERAGRTDVPTGAIVELTPKMVLSGGWSFAWGDGAAWFGRFAQTSSTYSTNVSTSVPSGFTLVNTINGVGLPSVTDTVRVRMTSIASSGATVMLMVCPRWSLYVGPATGGPSGWFVVQARVNGWYTVQYQDIACGPWAAGSPLYLAGCTAIETARTVGAAATFVEVDIDYRVMFLSTGSFSGDTPELILNVCTGASAMWDLVPTGWNTSNTLRGSFGVPSCPSAVIVAATP
jgi:hypothetical protein